MGGFLKSKGKKVKAFESPGITDAGIMNSKDLFNVPNSAANLSTAGRGSAIMDIGSMEGRKLTKRARKRATKVRA